MLPGRALGAGRHGMPMGLAAVSRGLKQRLAILGIAEERVHVLRNRADPTLFRPTDRDAARRVLGLIRPTLLAVGNLVRLKSHRMMVEALLSLLAVDPVIVGEGPERAAIEAGVADRVRLLGHVQQDRLPDIYSAADLLLLVSTREGWPNVLLESMACGTLVIASDIDAIADIVAAPEAGRILKEPTAERLAATAREFLAALPARAATHAYAEGFDWQSTPEGQVTLFHEICKHRLGRGGVRHAASAGAPEHTPRRNGRHYASTSVRYR